MYTQKIDQKGVVEFEGLDGAIIIGAFNPFKVGTEHNLVPTLPGEKQALDLRKTQYAIVGMDRFKNMRVALCKAHRRWIGHPAVLRELGKGFGHTGIIEKPASPVSLGVSPGLGVLKKTDK
jgi:uncharacterized membrane protein YuzA (DUF378 family)